MFYNSSLKPQLLSDTSNYLNVVLSKEYDFDPENLISFTFTDSKYYYTLTGSKRLPHEVQKFSS